MEPKIYDRRAICALLDAHGIAYTLVEHPRVYTSAQGDALALPFARSVAKNLFMCSEKKTAYFLFSLRAHGRADLKALAAAVGEKRLRFATEDDLFTLLHLEKGAVTPLGALNDAGGRVAVYLDASFAGQSIVVHPNDNGATLCLATNDLASSSASRSCTYSASVFCRRCMKACRPHPKTARRPHEDDKETTPNRKGDYFTNYPKRPHVFLCGLIFLPAECSAGFLSVCAVLAAYLLFLHFFEQRFAAQARFRTAHFLKRTNCKANYLYKCKAHGFTKYDGFR